MKFKIHWEIKGVEDSIILEGEDIQDIRDQVAKVVPENAENKWSEEL